MTNYTLSLKTDCVTPINLPLQIKDDNDVILDYHSKVKNAEVYYDRTYNITCCDEDNNPVVISNIFINNERSKNNSRLFLECYGFAKIEVTIDETQYVTENITILIKKGTINTSIVNMIEYIYENCDDYLYEEHKHSKISSGINTSDKISLDSKLSLIEGIYDSYTKCFMDFKYSAKSKLIKKECVDDFSKLETININTIQHISTHPENLYEVSYNSGICVNKQYYQPKRTLISTNTSSFNIYENQVIVGFLKTIVKDLKLIVSDLNAQINQNKQPIEKNGYIESSYYIYKKNHLLYNEYIKELRDYISKFSLLYFEYKSIFNIEGIYISSKPKYTQIFRKLKPYALTLAHIYMWFECGDHDFRKSNLLLSFVSVSKIYEYYCLLKIIRSIESADYTRIQSTPFKYREQGYYKNTIYNNTFVFSKMDIEITVYFQPKVEASLPPKEKDRNFLNLYRNTSICIDKNECIYKNIDNFYTPDIIIKATKKHKSYYLILDSKHSYKHTVIREQLMKLVFKYLFSISTLNEHDLISGMYILCGKETSNGYTSIHDIDCSMGKETFPKSLILNMSGLDINDNSGTNKIMENIFTLLENTEDSVREQSQMATR